jgi:hypothetical protein
MDIKGNNQYIAIPNEFGIFADEPIFIERGSTVTTNYDEIKELKERADGSQMQLPIVTSTENYIVDLLMSEENITTPELDEKLIEKYGDRGVVKKAVNTVVEGIVYLYDSAVGLILN